MRSILSIIRVGYLVYFERGDIPSGFGIRAVTMTVEDV